MKKSLSYHQYTDFDLEIGGLKKLDFIVDKINKTFSGIFGIKILDVGSGAGNISRPLAYLGFEVLALDESRRAIKTIEERNSFSNLAIARNKFENFETGDKFEVIIMSEFLEHTSDPKAVLEKAAKLLKDDGIVILTVPNGLSAEEIIRKNLGATSARRIFKNRLKEKMVDENIQSPAESSHLHFWSYFAVKRLLGKSDFKIVNIKNASTIFKEFYYIFGRFFIKRGSRPFHLLDSLDNFFSKIILHPLASGWIVTPTKKNE